MLVYRLQTDDCGPYNVESKIWGKDWFKGMLKSHADIFHPYAKMDGLTWKKNLRFACPSKLLLLQWFNGYWDYFNKSGACVLEYETKNYKYGKSKLQLTFNIEKATLIRELSVGDFIDECKSDFGFTE